VALTVSGIEEAIAALQGMAERVEAATPGAIVTSQALIASEARTRLRKYQHPPGTPTPAPPGGPPAMITGRLRGSFDIAGPTAAGAGVWMSVMGPTAPYARVQELGGATGRGGATVLPARPYLKPSIETLTHSGRLADVFVRAWAAAITG
jgi:phage gpG-like protein